MQGRKTFVEYLKEENIDQPNTAVLITIVKRYSQNLEAALSIGDASVCVDLYETVKQLPSTFTMRSIEEQLHISINGPMSLDQPNILTAVDLSGRRALLIKLLKVPESNAFVTCQSRNDGVNAEIYACKTVASLKDAENLVKCEVVDVTVQHNERWNVAAVKWTVLMMERYLSALSPQPQLNEELILEGFNQIVSGLRAMHSAGLVHMDVKNDNVFVDNALNWYLGDFGSTRNIGEKMWSITDVFNPYEIKSDTTVIPSFDFVQLCVMIAVELDKDSWKGRLCGYHDYVQEDLIRKCLCGISNEHLKIAVLELFDTHMEKATSHLKHG